MGVFGKTDFEKEYDLLTDSEKNIINTTSLSIEDIKHYENLLNRKMTERELKITGVLCNNGCILTEDDFKKSESNLKPLSWLYEKFGIVKGSSYIEPNITLRQCASFITEYLIKQKATR